MDVLIELFLELLVLLALLTRLHLVSQVHLFHFLILAAVVERVLVVGVFILRLLQPLNLICLLPQLLDVLPCLLHEVLVGCSGVIDLLILGQDLLIGLNELGNVGVVVDLGD